MKKICDNCHAKVAESADKCPMCGSSLFTPENFQDLSIEDKEHITQSKYGYDKGHVFAICLISLIMFVLGIVGVYHSLTDNERVNIGTLMTSIVVLAGGCYYLYIAIKNRKRE